MSTLAQLDQIHALKAEAMELHAAAYGKDAEASSLEGDVHMASHYTKLATNYRSLAQQYRSMGKEQE